MSAITTNFMNYPSLTFVGICSVLLVMTGCSLPSDPPVQKACTQEAKICPDGSAVGRTGPQCTFSPCPIGENKKIFSDSIQKIQFWYADPFPTKFITTETWPPKVSISDKEFSCQEGGAEIQVSGKSVQKNLEGNTYCITTQSEGAAGSTYTTYTYKVTKNETLITFDFILRLVQCSNYDDPQKTECKKERNTFNPDHLVIDMRESLQFLE